jgi:hypothetical protein
VAVKKPVVKKPAAAAKTAATPKKKKIPKVKARQNWACEVCGLQIRVDACGCVERHVFLCCEQEMVKQKKKSKAKKKKKK